MNDMILMEAERVASLCDFNVRTLWRLVAAGKFPQPVRLSRKLVRWDVRDIRAWLDFVRPSGRTTEKRNTGNEERLPEAGAARGDGRRRQVVR